MCVSSHSLAPGREERASVRVRPRSKRTRTYAGDGGSAQSRRGQSCAAPSCAGSASSSWSWGQSGRGEDEVGASVGAAACPVIGGRERTSAVALARKREGTRRALCEAARRRRCRGSVWKARFVFESLSGGGQGDSQLLRARAPAPPSSASFKRGAPGVLHGRLHRSNLEGACLWTTRRASELSKGRIQGDDRTSANFST